MKFIFIAKGRLGNAIFRYMGCATFCIKYNAEYTTKLNTINGTINDRLFSEIINNNIPLQDGNYLLSDYYQHDAIYKKYAENDNKEKNTEPSKTSTNKNDDETIRPRTKGGTRRPRRTGCTRRRHRRTHGTRRPRTKNRN